jgi:hypothetical protein
MSCVYRNQASKVFPKDGDNAAWGERFGKKREADCFRNRDEGK